MPKSIQVMFTIEKIDRRTVTFAESEAEAVTIAERLWEHPEHYADIRVFVGNRRLRWRGDRDA